MKSRRRSKRLRILHLWTLGEVQKAVPYLRSVIGSLREHCIDALNTERRLDLAAKSHPSPQRTQLVTRQELQDERSRSERKFDDALEELNRINVYLLDAVKGLALIPFRKENDLAWFVFDLFTSRGLIGWRYDNDPIEECRPLRLLEAPVGNDPLSN
jgi:Uncharacterized conserved protein (DUF2203)